MARAGGDPGQEARLIATYFDTPDGALARQGLTLRVREQAGSFVQTVKSAGGNDVGDGTGGAALVRGEWEDPVAGASPDPQAPQTGRFIPAEAADALRRAGPHRDCPPNLYAPPEPGNAHRGGGGPGAGRGGGRQRAANRSAKSNSN